MGLVFCLNFLFVFRNNDRLNMPKTMYDAKCSVFHTILQYIFRNHRLLLQRVS